MHAYTHNSLYRFAVWRLVNVIRASFSSAPLSQRRFYFTKQAPPSSTSTEMHIEASRQPENSVQYINVTSARMYWNSVWCGKWQWYEYSHWQDLGGGQHRICWWWWGWWVNAGGQQMKIDFAGVCLYNCLHPNAHVFNALQDVLMQKHNEFTTQRIT